VQSTPCAGLTPVVVPGCALALSRECRSDPVTWSLLQASHAARIRRLRLSWPGCVLRPLRGLQDGSEALIHLQCCHAPCEISRRNVRLRTAPLSGDGVAATNVSASRWTELPSGGPVRRLCRWPADEPCLLREARCGRCAERRPAGQGSFGKPGSIRSCSDGASHAESGTAPFGEPVRHTVAVRWMPCLDPGPTPNQIARLPTTSDRKGGQRRSRDECLQLRCKLTLPFEPARSFSCLRSAPQADVDRKVVRRGARTPSLMVGSSARMDRAVTRSNAPSSDVTIVPGGIPVPSGAGPPSETF